MQIAFHELELQTHIGVPQDERSAAQRIVIDLILEAENTKAHRTDKIEDTVDYQKILEVSRSLAQEERKTLEKLAEDIAQAVLDFEHVHKVTVTVKKFILPEVKDVSLTITRP